MKITGDTLLSELLEKYPFLADEAVKIDPRFKIIRSPVAKHLLRRATVSELAEKGGVDEGQVIDKISELIAEGEKV